MAFISSKNNKLSLSNDPKEGIGNADELLSLAAKNNIQTFPLDIEKLLKFLGITLVREDGEESFSGCIEKRSNAYFICVNKDHHPKRIRFTIAHELGHYFLHRNRLSEIGREEVLMREPNSLSQIEREANNFAADLLMPRDAFFKELRDGNDSASELSDIFDVSIPAIKYRAHQLKIL